MSHLEVLQEIGLTERESELYLTSLSLGPSSLLGLSRAADMHRPILYKLLDGLLRRGLFTLTINGNRKLYNAIDPVQLTEYVHRKEQALEQAMPGLLALVNTIGQKPGVRFYEGEKAVKEVLFQTNLTPSKQLLCFFPDQFLVTTLGRRDMEHLSKDRIKRKVHIRTIRSHQSGEDISGFKQEKTALREIRYTTAPLLESGMGLVLHDNVITIFSPADECYALQITSTAFSNLMRYFFEQAWLTSGEYGKSQYTE
jgi:sugar-specific transcriptional regulator TrmB